MQLKTRNILKFILTIIISMFCLNIYSQTKSFNFSDTYVTVGATKVLPSDICFVSSCLCSKDSSKIVADSIAYFMVHNPNVKIEIGDHTDYRGSETTNQKLTQERATSIKTYLVDVKKINPLLITAIGYGENHPIFTEAYIDKTTKGKSKAEYEAMMQKNRRVTITILNPDK